MKKISIILSILLLGGIALLSPSCVDFSFDPVAPRVDSTNLTANTSIAELKAMYPGELYQLDETTFFERDSIIIEGVVISDDKEGNFYKSLFIQDETGAIELKLNKTTLYNEYKRGQKVVVYCNGLYLGDYGGQIQLGSIYSNNGNWEISGLEGDPIISQHVFKKGSTLTEITPLVMSTAELKPSNIGKLVKFEDVQIKDTLNKLTNTVFTFADSENKITLNHELVSCSQAYTSPIVLRTSGYSKFANNEIPTGNGWVVGILTYYKGTYQLLMRDLNDISFTNDRCQL
ncbi:DUF5689 domain-containing protein [Tenuifilum thalassicum]|uniref:DUF5689 domain-containing protein n=1 Tax=Tenuifilum thalassicum TaxID=2590900 RepID=A0A7D4BSV1_9BACT|nr:DUF5689 domain-containing protein [Tenuifilum thalassicum]QKG80741.1 hypothetical protein FHG85_10845 [Tenuifilum thalassicum]